MNQFVRIRRSIMKQYDVNINVRVELEDEADLSAVLGQLMYIPSIAGGNARLTGLNMYKIVPSGIESIGAGAGPSTRPIGS